MKKKLSNLVERCFSRRKMLRRIELTLIILLVWMPGVHAMGIPQQIKVSVDCQNKTLGQIFKDLEKQTQLYFFFSDKSVNVNQKMTLVVHDKGLEEVLKQLMGDNYEYNLLHNLIVLTPKENPEVPQQRDKMKISGIVVDKEGNPLPGVTLLLKGTKLGGATDVDGKFKLELPAKSGDIFVVSFVGMKTQEVRILPDKPIRIMLKPEEQMIDEVVVTGYQKIDRKLFTGAAARVKMDDIKLGGEADVAKALEGQVAGVTVQNMSSTFGTAPKIRIRGASSIYGNQKPLWVIDGVVLEDAVEVSVDQLNSGDLSTLISSGVAGLNTDDIESMQILKDVSATALYGARAMNGVIVITTKKGRAGKVNVNYSTNISIRPRPVYSDYNILNSSDQMSINRELYEKGWTNVAKTQFASAHGPYGKMFDLIAKNQLPWVENDDQVNIFLRKYEIANTDWFNELFKTGIQQQHTISISGGGEKATFYASVGYLRDGGWTIADDVDRYTALLKGTFNFTKQFSATVQTNLSYRDQQLSGVSDSKNDVNGVNRWTGRIERNFDNNPFIYALTTSRAIRAYDENHNLEFFRRNYTDYNIIDELSKNVTGVTVRDMSFMADLNYNILPNLSVSTKVSARYFQSETSRKIHETSNEANAYRAGTMSGDSEIIRDNNNLLYKKPGSTTGIKYSVLPEGGIYSLINDIMSNYYMTANVNWNPRINENHAFTTLLGAEVRYVDREKHWNDGFGHFFDGGNVSKPSPNYLEKLSITGKSYFGKSATYDRFAAFFFNYGYSYQGKYTLNGTVRYDGSNRLGRSRTARWLPTWNISGKWAVKEENFMQSFKHLTTLNLRATYGLNASLGNASNSTLVARARASSRPFHPELSELEIYIVDLENSDLTWEKQYELNLGLDLGFFDNRMNWEFNYYNRKGFDLIGNYESNGVGGQRTKIGNIADMDSHGFELALNATPVKIGDFRWNFNINYSFHKTKIKNLITKDWVSRAVSTYGVPVNGGPVRGIYSSRFAGLDHRGIPMFYDRNNEKVLNLDVQTDDFADFVYSGNLEPTTNAGMQHTLSWRGINLSVLFTGQFGHKKRVMQDFSYSYNDSEALTAHLKNRWRVAGDEQITDIPAILDADMMNRDETNDIRVAYRLYGMSDRWIADASFIRLKSLSLSYSFPQRWLKGAKISHVNLGLQATNLALLWLADRKKLNGEDPEFVWSGGTSMPISKQYTVTFSIGF